MRILSSLKCEKYLKKVKGGPLRISNIHSVEIRNKLKGASFKKIGKKVSQCRKRGRLIVSKKWKGGPFCFRMVLYLMLKALFAFKSKYQVPMVKVHKNWTNRVELTKKYRHCKSSTFPTKTPTKY